MIGGSEMSTQNKEVTKEFLASFTDAWNRHDIDALMEHMTDDCLFQGSTGPEVDGSHWEGYEQVRRGFSSLWDNFTDAHFEPVGEDFIAGNRGVCEWIFTGTKQDGTTVRARGCDVFTFKNGKIQIKNSFRKQGS